MFDATNICFFPMVVCHLDERHAQGKVLIPFFFIPKEFETGILFFLLPVNNSVRARLLSFVPIMICLMSLYVQLMELIFLQREQNPNLSLFASSGRLEPN